MKFFFLLALFSSLASATSRIIQVEENSQDDLEVVKLERKYKTKEHFRQECEKRIDNSCISLAHFEAFNEVPVAAMVSLQNEKSILQNKCNKLDMNACFYLAQMISNTENDFFEVKNLLERACYYFQHRLACESLTRFERKMGLRDIEGVSRVCLIVGVWCSYYRGRFFHIPVPKLRPPIIWVSTDFFFYQRLIYQMTVQEWIPRGLTIIPLEMKGWGRGIVY